MAKSSPTGRAAILGQARLGAGHGQDARERGRVPGILGKAARMDARQRLEIGAADGAQA